MSRHPLSVRVAAWALLLSGPWVGPLWAEHRTSGANSAQSQSATSDAPATSHGSPPGPAPEPVECDSRQSSAEWAQTPRSIRPGSRPGNFSVPPQGVGYYSLSDLVTGNCREKPPQSGYVPFGFMPSSLYDADFRFVDKLDPASRTWVERLKRIELGDCWLFSTGGQFWIRTMHEHNSRLTEADNNYELVRTRIFGDLMYGDLARVYGEFLWADSFSEDLPPLAIDANRGDILNLFADVNLFEYEGHPVFVRAGRQELQFGSQRLISALDWANTRRTFDGVRAFRTGEKWDWSAFYTQFVPAVANQFDRPDEHQDFAGSWLTYRPRAGQSLDFYYLFLQNTNAVVQQGIVRAPADIHTVGTRWAGDRDGFLWDYESMLQLGDQQGADLVAGAASAGMGRHLADWWGTPSAWIYYDYASGDTSPNQGQFTTFNQLYPFGHYYLGWLDQVGRQNIQDLNAHLNFYPAPWVTVLLQYHHFWLASPTDALYNPAGTAIRRDPTGAAGRNVGDELDVVVNFHTSRYADVLLGYSKLYGGGFLERTAGPNQAADSEFFHLMYQRKW